MALGTQSILVATDFSAAADLAVDAAALLAKQFGAQLHLVHVFDPTPMAPLGTRGSGVAQANAEQRVEQQIRDELGRIREERLPDVARVETQLILAPSPADAICKYAAQHAVDLIVVSTHGRTGLAHLLVGSVAEKVVRHAPCPVLTLRSKAKS